MANRRRALLIVVLLALAISSIVLLRRSQETEQALDAWCAGFLAVHEFTGDPPTADEYAALVSAEHIGTPPSGSQIARNYRRLLDAITASDERNQSAAQSLLTDRCHDRVYGSFY